MSNISSNSLFHFVKEEEYLQLILKEGFWPYYCVEYGWDGNDYAIPMLCYCDIPLSQIGNHITKYGGEGFGIGVSKQWALNNGISPVFYVTYKSDLYKDIKNGIKEMQTNQLGKGTFVEKLFCRCKRTTASEYERKKYGSKKKPKFYNEREWRFVPNITEEIHPEYCSISTKGEFEQDWRSQLSEKTKDKKLKITPSDINYIFVPDESHRDNMINFIKGELEEENADILVSKIAIVNHLLKDS